MADGLAGSAEWLNLRRTIAVQPEVSNALALRMQKGWKRLYVDF